MKKQKAVSEHTRKVETIQQQRKKSLDIAKQAKNRDLAKRMSVYKKEVSYYCTAWRTKTSLTRIIVFVCMSRWDVSRFLRVHVMNPVARACVVNYGCAVVVSMSKNRKIYSGQIS